MIHFLVAFDAEARPLIDHFKLKRLHHEPSFPVYLSDQHALIVSGAGKIAAAAATAHLHGLTGFQHQQVWINIGIAGHPSLPLGTTCLCHQLTDKRSRQRLYPQLVSKSPWLTKSLLTLDDPDPHYADKSLIDMEASSFFLTANRYTTAELIQVVKIVSDNADQPLRGTPSKQTVIELLMPQMQELTRFSDRLDQLANQLKPDWRIDEASKRYLKQFHFSFSQTESLRQLLQQRIALDSTISMDQLMNVEAQSSKLLLNNLRQLIRLESQPS